MSKVRRTEEAPRANKYARDINVCDVDARLTCAVIEVERPDGYIERTYLSETEAEIVERGLRDTREGSA